MSGVLSTLNSETFGCIIDGVLECQERFVGEQGADLLALSSTCERILDDEVKKLEARVEFGGKHFASLTAKWEAEWAEERKRLLQNKHDINDIFKEFSDVILESVIKVVKP